MAMLFPSNSQPRSIRSDPLKNFSQFRVSQISPLLQFIQWRREDTDDTAEFCTRLLPDSDLLLEFLVETSVLSQKCVDKVFRPCPRSSPRQPSIRRALGCDFVGQGSRAWPSLVLGLRCGCRVGYTVG